MAVTVPAATEQIDYADLYARWEKGNWSATAIDFAQDRVDWHEKLTDEQRRGALWLYTLFFHGEDSVADNLSPYIDAAPLEEQKYFLATQQVDEARHAVFFKRFMHEVVGVGDGDVASALAGTEPQLTWGHRQVFSRLDGMADELRKDRSKPKLAAAVTLYHLVVEASLAQPGQHMIDASLEEMEVLPGFREGMRNVSIDEQRHIGFGVKLLSDLYREDPDTIQEAIVGAIREVSAWTLAVPMPPGGDRSYTECFGFTLEDLFEVGAQSLTSRLRAVGLPLEQLTGLPIPVDLPPREAGERGIKLMYAGYLGREFPVTPDPEATAILFDSIRRQADGRHVPEGTTIQWDFTDAEPWYLRLDNGTTAVAQGRVADPSVRLRLRFEDWVLLSSERADPLRLLLRGRLRIKGDPRVLVKMPRIFG